MANFDGNAYEQFLDNQTKSEQRQKTRLDSIQPNSRILVFNSMWAGRCPDKVQTWKTVEKVTRYSAGVVEILCTDGKTISGRDVILVANFTDVETWMICLNDRKNEFVGALNRAGDKKFEVYSDWEQDAFVVVNLENGHEYHVTLKARGGKVFGSCICKDFNSRNRLCKHIGKVLQYAFSGVLPKIGLAAEVV